MAFSKTEVLRDNIQAIEIAIYLETQDTVPNAQDIEALKKYKGFGGISEVLYALVNANGEYYSYEAWKQQHNIASFTFAAHALLKQLHGLIHKHNPKLWDSIKASNLTAFFTPRDLVQAQITAIAQSGHKVQYALDPCAGAGIYVEEILQAFPKLNRIDAVEKDPLTALILKARFKEDYRVFVHNSAFENFNAIAHKGYDLVASNIPFGNIKVFHPNYSPATTAKIHNFFFYHANELLAPYGILSFVSSTGVLNSKQGEDFRKLLFEKNNPLNVHFLPNNTFKDEANTEVSSLVYTGQKAPVNKSMQQLMSATQTINYQGEDISVNGLLAQYFLQQREAELFLFQKPEIQSNPYGKPELAYTMAELNFAPVAQVELNPIANFLNIQFKTEIEPLQGTLFSLAPESLLSQKLDHEDVKKVDLDTVRSHGSIYLAYENGSGKALEVLSAKDRLNQRHLRALKIGGNIPYTHGVNEGFLETEPFKAQFLNLLKNWDADKRFRFWVEGDDAAFKDYVYQQTTNFASNKQNALAAFVKQQEKATENLFSKNLLSPAEQKHLSTEGHYVLLKDQLEIYKVWRNENKAFEFKPATTIDKAYFGIKDSFSAYLQNKTDANKQALREAHKAFQEYYPYLRNAAYLFSGEFYYSRLQQLEIQQNNQIVLSDLLQDKGPRKLHSPVLAMFRSMKEKGHVDFDFIAQHTSKNKKEIQQALGDLIVFSPWQKQYLTKTHFLRGNLYDLQKQLVDFDSIAPKELSTDQLEAFLQTKDFVKAQIPAKKQFEEIDFQLGSRWIPMKFYEQFWEQHYHCTAKLDFDQKTDLLNIYGIGVNADYNSRVFQTKGNRYVRPQDIFENAFYQIYPQYTYTVENADGSKEKFVDNEATQRAKNEIEVLQNKFKLFLQNLNTEDKTNLQDFYNYKFNNKYVEEHTDALYEDLYKHMDGIINLEKLGIEGLRNKQKKGILQLFKNMGGLADHEVGLGKTLTMIVASVLMKELGPIEKPLILGLKANTQALAKTYELAFPDAKLLYPKSNDLSPKNRSELINKIAVNDWDCIIMTHDQFSKIPQDEQIQSETLKEEIRDVDRNLETLQNSGEEVSKRMIRGLEIRKQNLEAQLKKLEMDLQKRKDANLPSFKETGIDHSIIDESHYFKNLQFNTRHDRVAGLGNPLGAQKTYNMLIAIRTIQEKFQSDFGASFLSGTPISNSLTEAYTLEKYLVPNKLKSEGLYNFDAWASTFARKEVDYEMNVVNQLVQKERFRYFINTGLLSEHYLHMADIGKVDSSEIQRPQLKEKLHIAPQSYAQNKFYTQLMESISRKDFSIMNLPKNPNLDEKATALSIIAMNLAFQASIDLRLLYPNISEHSKTVMQPYGSDDLNLTLYPSKINNLCLNVLDIYNKYNAQKGTQIIFSDVGTPKKKLGINEMVDYYMQDEFIDVYHDIKFKLMSQGIPEEQIAFIHSYNTINKKQQLEDAMNAGEIRILIGSTQKAGTGLNVQRLLTDIHHLTLPWKPSELEQRNGRGYRQGNELGLEVGYFQTHYYLTENTLDSFKLDLLKNKKRFIDQIKQSTQTAEEFDEGNLSESTGMNLGEFHAKLTGDDTLLLKSKAEKEYKSLLNIQRSYAMEESKWQRNLDNLERRLEASVNRKDFLETNLKFLHDHQKLNEQQERVDTLELHIDGKTYLEPQQTAAKLRDIAQRNRDPFLIMGSFNGFNMVAQYNKTFNLNEFFLVNPKLNHGHQLLYSDGIIAHDASDRVCNNYFTNVCNKLEQDTLAIQKGVGRIKNELESLKRSTPPKFNTEDEKRILALQDRIKELGEQLNKGVGNKTQTLMVEHNQQSFPLLRSYTAFIRKLQLNNLSIGENNFLVDKSTQNLLKHLSQEIPHAINDLQSASIQIAPEEIEKHPQLKGEHFYKTSFNISDTEALESTIEKLFNSSLLNSISKALPLEPALLKSKSI